MYYLTGVCLRQLGDENAARDAFEKAAMGDNTPAGAMYYNDQPADMILYRGLAHQALGRNSEALKCFHQLVDYGETHLFDTMRIDYFAVSLPELQLFEEDLTARNRLHCHFLIGLGCLGLGLTDRAEQELVCVLQSDPAHTGAVWMTHPESRALGL
ncbi:tetratricopeptide repeat protein [Allofournierella massiliensis]|uniref:tetratricopeptide repeat protein n=1 Tax=Allofournierella massiliensis TaxID=1650663 RepID=UPI0032C45465